MMVIIKMLIIIIKLRMMLFIILITILGYPASAEESAGGRRVREDGRHEGQAERRARAGRHTVTGRNKCSEVGIALSEITNTTDGHTYGRTK